MSLQLPKKQTIIIQKKPTTIGKADLNKPMRVRDPKQFYCLFQSKYLNKNKHSQSQQLETNKFSTQQNWNQPNLSAPLSIMQRTMSELKPSQMKQIQMVQNTKENFQSNSQTSILSLNSMTTPINNNTNKNRRLSKFNMLSVINSNSKDKQQNISISNIGISNRSIAAPITSNQQINQRKGVNINLSEFEKIIEIKKQKQLYFQEKNKLERQNQTKQQNLYNKSQRKQEMNENLKSLNTQGFEKEEIDEQDTQYIIKNLVKRENYEVDTPAREFYAQTYGKYNKNQLNILDQNDFRDTGLNLCKKNVVKHINYTGKFWENNSTYVKSYQKSLKLSEMQKQRPTEFNPLYDLDYTYRDLNQNISSVLEGQSVKSKKRKLVLNQEKKIKYPLDTCFQKTLVPIKIEKDSFYSSNIKESKFF